jgi:hypothetical protein
VGLLSFIYFCLVIGNLSALSLRLIVRLLACPLAGAENIARVAMLLTVAMHWNDFALPPQSTRSSSSGTPADRPLYTAGHVSAYLALPPNQADPKAVSRRARSERL